MVKIVLTADQFADVEDRVADFDPEAEFMIHYSGRGMYGAECVGVIHKDARVVTVFLAVVADVLDRELLELLYDLGSSEEDSMGLSTITYWRNLTAEGSDE